LAWRAYVRRFDLGHTVRFCKQALGWTTPRPRHPEQAERWTWLVVAAHTQLCLARQVVVDQRLDVGSAPAPEATVALAGPAGISAPAVGGGLPGQHTETLRALARAIQGPTVGARRRCPAVKKAA
jgi:hypothetical protein